MGIRVENIAKSFATHGERLPVLANVAFSVADREFVSIIGPSGSGKTTLLRCVNYLEKPSAGHVWVDGTLIGEKQVDGRFVHLSDRELARERAEIGFVFQRFNLFGHLTALENVAEAPIRVRGRRREHARECARSLLADVGLSDKLDAQVRKYKEKLTDHHRSENVKRAVS